MKRFVVYRPKPPENYVKDGYANPVDQIQFEGIQFTNGKVAVCWRTETSSISIWDSLDDLMKIHGHPEYETVFKWLDSS